MQTKYIKTVTQFLAFSAIFLITACGSNDYQRMKSEMTEKYNCSNIDDCLSKYNFEGARAHMAAEDEEGGVIWGGYDGNIEKVSRAEVIYLAKQGEYELALNIINEDNYPLYGERTRQNLKYSILDIAVNKYCEEGDYQKAKQFALKASNSHNIEGWAKEDTNDFDETKIQQSVLLNKIEEYRKVME